MLVSGLLRKIGERIDEQYQKKVGANPIPGSVNRLLLICYHDYQGPKQVVTDDGVTVNPGEPVGEFHFNNKKITELGAEQSERSLEWRLFEILKKEFKTLAEAIDGKLVPNNIKAFYGVNVLAVGARRLGFTLVPIPPGWGRWWLGFWESVLRLIFYSFKTKKKATLKRTMDPYEVWISSNELLRRYK
ncbi:MAG: hypothetical protein GXY86_11590 [Firmicutes bacterium]|nr:hypothetical protein [Bacillota bacterium]